MDKKSEVLKAIKAHRLYKDYHSPTNEIPRGEITQEINPSGEATSRLFDLKRRLKQAVMKQTDFPPDVVKDNDEMQQLIQTAIVAIYADEDGRVSPTDFRKLFNPLAGMVEGLLARMNSDDANAMMDLRSFKQECVNKAFYKQLKKLMEKRSIATEDGYTLGKALSSMLTHVFIDGEKRGKLNEQLVDKINGMIRDLREMSGPAVVRDVLLEVRGWRFVESDKLPDLKSETLASEKKMSFTGTVKGSGKPDHKVIDDWDGSSDGKGAKAKVKPNGLIQAPGNPEDTPDGKVPEQKGEWMDGKTAKKIDGQELSPDEKEVPAKKENVEVRIVKDTPVLVEYDIVAGGKKVGSAKLNRMGKSGMIRGEVLEHSIEADSAFKLRLVASKILKDKGQSVCVR
jgi:hypothetical protein